MDQYSKSHNGLLGKINLLEFFLGLQTIILIATVDIQKKKSSTFFTRILSSFTVLAGCSCTSYLQL